MTERELRNELACLEQFRQELKQAAVEDPYLYVRGYGRPGHALRLVEIEQLRIERELGRIRPKLQK